MVNLPDDGVHSGSSVKAGGVRSMLVILYLVISKPVEIYYSPLTMSVLVKFDAESSAINSM